MTKKLADQLFENVRPTDSEQVIEDLELSRCTFVSSGLVQHENPNPSLAVRHVKAARCTLNKCSISGARFEDVTIDNLVIKGGTQYISGCVFSEVKISGKIGPLMITPPTPVPGGELVPGANQAIVSAYKSIDWALDISEAEFADVTLDYVPGDLVRREPQTQFLLRRESLLKLDGRTLPEDADIFFNRLNLTPFDSIVVAVPTRSKQSRWFLDTLSELRDLGLAE